MNVLIFDTETSGFPSTKLPAHKQAWVVQLAAAIVNMEGNNQYSLVSTFNEIIAADGRKIHPGAQGVHGISAEFTEEHGSDEMTVAAKFNTWKISQECGQVDCVVGHNLDFDMPMVSYMMARSQLPNRLLVHPQFCTMKNTVDMCRLPFAKKSFGGQKYKWPKLEELHKHLFGRTDFAAHDALEDVMATSRCFLHESVQAIFNPFIKEALY